jgi:hypothetical protein
VTDAQGAFDGITIDVRRGTPDEEELAALLAVVSEAYAVEAAHATVDETPRSAWSLTQRGLRTPLQRHLGWGRSSG